MRILIAPNKSTANECQFIRDLLDLDYPKKLFIWRDVHINRAVARTLIGGGGCIFIYSGSARLASFEINFISKETSRAEPEYMNIHPPPPPPPINALATALHIKLVQKTCSCLNFVDLGMNMSFFRLSNKQSLYH